jgi:hypothetical protein
MTSVLIASKVHKAVNEVMTALVDRRERSVRERAFISSLQVILAYANQKLLR